MLLEKKQLLEFHIGLFHLHFLEYKYIRCFPKMFPKNFLPSNNSCYLKLHIQQLIHRDLNQFHIGQNKHLFYKVEKINGLLELQLKQAAVQQQLLKEVLCLFTHRYNLKSTMLYQNQNCNGNFLQLLYMDSFIIRLFHYP